MLDILTFNKEVYLKSVYPAIIKPTDVNSLAKVVAIKRAAGLEIYAIEDYKSEDTRPFQQNQDAQNTPSPQVSNTNK